MRNKRICDVFQELVTMVTIINFAMDTEYFGKSSTCILLTLLLNIITLSTPAKQRMLTSHFAKIMM